MFDQSVVRLVGWLSLVMRAHRRLRVHCCIFVIKCCRKQISFDCGAEKGPMVTGSLAGPDDPNHCGRNETYESVRQSECDVRSKE